MSEDEFTKLYKFMQSEFKIIHEGLEKTATKDELNLLTNAVDAFTKQSETYMQEMLALGHKVDRLE
jgi:hypothetical protein